MKNQPAVVSLWTSIASRESRLLALLRTAVQIIWVTDAEGRASMDDPEPPADIADLTWAAFTGMSNTEAAGAGWMAAVHPDDRAGVLAVKEKATRTGNDMQAEFRVRHRSGEWRSVVSSGQAVRDAAGAVIAWYGTCVDVTSIRRAEAAHREIQERLLAALDAGEMTTWIWQASDQRFYWDATGGRLWGLDPGQASSSDLAGLRPYIHPDDRAATIRAAELTAATGVFHSALFRVARPDGRLQWLQTRGRVEKDTNGHVVRVIGAFVDVTKLRTTEEALRQTQKLQALGTLAGGIAHDFNNLVLAIGGNAQLALADVDPPHPAYTSLQEIARAAARASDLVRRILAFATREPLAPAITPLQPAILDAVNLLAANVPSNVSIETHFDDETVACALGSAELGQVLTNLITNAIHALGTAPGTVRISVDPLSADLPAELNPGTAYVSVAIRDTGEGMSAETRARIFEPFFTTKPTGKGTGLGLAVVHGIVTAGGGALVVDSEVGRGSTFRVWLPRATQAVAAADDRQAAPVAARGEHILYVDDDESIGYLMRRTLERAGYRVTCHVDAREVVQTFRNGGGDVDVVVTDLSMPGMSGFDLVVALRSIPADVPVLMTSGYTREDDQQRAAQLGIGRIILKPDTVEDLARELDRRCAELRVRRAGSLPSA